jgi:hypothetical protein
MSGEDFFGLNHPTVVKMLEQLPNARKCENYQFDFDVFRLSLPTKHVPSHIIQGE